jgi:hypothetical protein
MPLCVSRGLQPARGRGRATSTRPPKRRDSLPVGGGAGSTSGTDELGEPLPHLPLAPAQLVE